jgi:acetoin utilization deacetylase AcuC-like enzyme
MKAFHADRQPLVLPQGHRFPATKYRRLRSLVEAWPELDVREAEPAPDAILALAHEPRYVQAIAGNGLSAAEQRAIGFPWSEAMVERARRSVGATLAAARTALVDGVAANLAGGTHHASAARGSGYCVFNDVAVALSRLRADDVVMRALVVDCDVHQGDGTADLLGPDPQCFTLSLHGARNYPFERIPSDLDVDIPSGAGDASYLRALSEALDVALHRAPPDFAFYLAGADPWHGDRLGRLALSKRGLRERDELALDRLLEAGAAVCVVLAGGYAEDVRDTVDINAGTAAAVYDRVRARTAAPRIADFL